MDNQRDQAWADETRYNDNRVLQRRENRSDSHQLLLRDRHRPARVPGCDQPGQSDGSQGHAVAAVPGLGLQMTRAAFRYCRAMMVTTILGSDTLPSASRAVT